MAKKAINQYNSFTGDPSEVNILVQEKSQNDPSTMQHKRADLDAMLNKKIVQSLVDGDTTHSPSADLILDVLATKQNTSDIVTLKGALSDFLSQLKTLIAQMVYTTSSNNAVATRTAIDNAITAMNIQTYSITRSLTRCTITNIADSIIGGESYTAILNPNSGYSLSSVTISMGGVDVTNSTYNSSTHTISIASVTGNLIITAIAQSDVPVVTYSITKHLTHCSLSNGAIAIDQGESYQSILTYDQNYEFNSILITMNNIDITNSVWNLATNSIEIASVTGNITIDAVATMIIPEYTQEILYENYTSTGTAFSKEVDINFAAGDYVEAVIDCTAETIADNSNIFCVAKSGNTDYLEYSKGEGIFFFKRYNSSTGHKKDEAHNRVKLIAEEISIDKWKNCDDFSNMVIKFDKDGAYINGSFVDSAISGNNIAPITSQTRIAVGARSSTKSPGVIYKTVSIYHKNNV